MIPMISMRARGEIAVHVYTGKVVAMNYPGGQVYRYTKNRSQSVSRAAKMFAPKRTGHLAGSVRIDVRPSPTRVVGRVRATARYARYVHEGTYGPIVPKNKKWLSVPQSRYSTKRRRLRRAVAGQDPNPFLAKALVVGMRQSYPTPLGPANPFV